jgi:hypothetical protein
MHFPFPLAHTICVPIPAGFFSHTELDCDSESEFGNPVFGCQRGPPGDPSKLLYSPPPCRPWAGGTIPPAAAPATAEHTPLVKAEAAAAAAVVRHLELQRPRLGEHPHGVALQVVYLKGKL